MDMLGKRKVKILSPFKVAQSVISHHEPETCTEIVEVDLRDRAQSFGPTAHWHWYLSFTPAKGEHHVSTSLNCFQDYV